MVDLVYAIDNAFIDMPYGPRLPVPKGSHWPADDPAVRARPELFSRDARWGMFYTPGHEPEGYDAPIEEATANPGERRNVRR